MRQDPLVSVIIPIYNVENYLSQAIDSIINQTYLNLEIILVNDGSSDNSLIIAEKYNNQDTRISLISQVNKGLSGARNTGLRIAKGKYIYFFDSDDYLKQNAIEECIDLLEKDNADLIRFGAEIHPESGSMSRDFKQNIYGLASDLNNQTLTVDSFLIDNKIFTPTVSLYIYNKRIIEENNLEFFEGIIHEDELWTTKILMYAESISFISKNFFLRRYRENSIMVNQSNLTKKGNDLLIISDELNKMKRLELSIPKRKLLNKRVVRNLVVGCIQSKKTLSFLLSESRKMGLSICNVFSFFIAKKMDLAVRSIRK
ncbi:putative glycosyltransferase EpsJ [Enterococcus casseliflavus]|uniref:Putative glycosyltransferase EpsJ n=1 Tax=Enterococcus casseliflavus TaxID=37734 RepID=A0A6N3FP96_ENTCA